MPEKFSRRTFLKGIGTGTLVAGVLPIRRFPVPDKGHPPNILFIMSDDHASRAVLLTGTYSHVNGQIDNEEVFNGAQPIFPKLLQEAGYPLRPDYTNRLETVKVNFKPRPVRYVKLIARNIRRCPRWHIGAGGSCWIFCDEIVIK